MMLSYLFYALAVVQLVVGLASLAAPETLYGQFGSLSALAVALARFYGATLLPLAYVSWVAASAAASPLRLSLVRASAVIPLIGLVVTAVMYPSGVISATQTAAQVIINGIFIIGFAYCGWIQRAEAG